MPNLLSFLFFVVYLFFLLATFLSLPILNELIMMCLGILLIFPVLELTEFLCLKLSSYVENFQPIVLQFFSLFSCLSLPVGF